MDGEETRADGSVSAEKATAGTKQLHLCHPSRIRARVVRDVSSAKGWATPGFNLSEFVLFAIRKCVGDPSPKGRIQ